MTTPEVAPTRTARLPKVTTATLDNGLHVVAARRGDIPMVEMRLILPLVAYSRSEAARRSLLARTLLAGTSQRSESALADALAELGATLGTSATPDAVTFSGSVPTANLTRFLELVAEVVEDAAFPSQPVRSERKRLADELIIAHTQPERIAADAVARVAFRRHPYGWGLVSPGAVARVTPNALRDYWSRATPRGGVLVLVGAATTTTTARDATDAFSGWKGGDPDSAPATAVSARAEAVVVDRPGAVQTNIRLVADAPVRTADDYAAADIANVVFGGYFASRYTANIREDKGYSYSPRSSITHYLATSMLSVAADVATEVTGPALTETRYELSRAAVGPLSAAEVASAVAYRLGTRSIATQSQAGLAGFLAAVVPSGLGIGYLRSHGEALAAVDATVAGKAATRWLAPRRFRAVIVGDASRIAASVEPLWPVEVVSRV